MLWALACDLWVNDFVRCFDPITLLCIIIIIIINPLLFFFSPLLFLLNVVTCTSLLSFSLLSLLTVVSRTIFFLHVPFLHSLSFLSFTGSLTTTHLNHRSQTNMLFHWSPINQPTKTENLGWVVSLFLCIYSFNVAFLLLLARFFLLLGSHKFDQFLCFVCLLQILLFLLSLFLVTSSQPALSLLFCLLFFFVCLITVVWCMFSIGALIGSSLLTLLIFLISFLFNYWSCLSLISFSLCFVLSWLILQLFLWFCPCIFIGLDFIDDLIVLLAFWGFDQF